MARCFRLAAALLVISSITVVGCNSSGSNDIFKGQISADNFPSQMSAGETAQVRLKVTNASSAKWPSDPKDAVRVSYHWLQKNGNIIAWDGERNFIPKALAPGESTLMDAHIAPPNVPGSYTLELDFVVDGPSGGWFGKKGSSTTRFDVEVK